MFFIASLSFLDPATFDLTTISFVALLLLLSLLSLCFIFHLRFKSRSCHHLRRFNSLWTVRFLLVSFISFWAFNELLRLSFFRRRYLYPFFPPIPIPYQFALCKLHVALSLGFLEPGFLITLLFLINVSAKNKTSNDVRALAFVLLTSIPILFLHILILLYPPLPHQLPSYFNRSYVLIKHDHNNSTVLCSYPLFSSIAFAGFGVAYMLWFLLSCWKLASLVINKSLRIRVYGLAFTIMFALPLQIIFLGLSALWKPDDPAYSVVILVVFFSTFLCAAAGEGILVIVPITDSLAAGVECRWECSGEELKSTATEDG